MCDGSARRWPLQGAAIPGVLLLLGAHLTAAQADDPGAADAVTTIPVTPLRTVDPPAERASTPRVIEEIVVTATKRATDIRDLPLSIDVFDGDALRDIGATSLESMLRFSPGVSVNPGLDPEAAQVIIRGVSTDTFFTFFTRTFGLFYEDVSLVNPSILGPQPNLDPFDMGVEVLKGPQGTLFGGSALSGAIRYVPNRPDTDASYGRLAAGIGSLARSDGLIKRYDGLWNQRLSDDLALRLVGSHNVRPGYVRDLRSGEDDINRTGATQVRGLVDWQASDALTLRLNLLHRDTRQDDGAFANNDQTPEHSQRLLPDELESTTTIAMFSGAWALPTSSITLILSHLDKDYPQNLDYSQFIGTSALGIGTYGDTDVASSQPSAELRWVSSTPTVSSLWLLDQWSHVIGYFYTEADQFLALEIGTLPSGGLLRLSGQVDAREHAVFVDLTKALSDRWQLGLGGRLFRQSTDADIRTDVIAVEGLSATLLPEVLLPLLDIVPGQGAVPLGRDQGTIGETVFNPKVTLRWRYSDDLSFFGAAVKGFRYAGANQNPTRDPNVPLFFDSDDIWNYEFGVRSRWWDNTLQIDATVFYLDWTDLQVQQREFTGAFAYSDNVGGARNRGVELGINWLLPANLTLALNGSYVDARTTTFFDDFQGPAPAGSELPGTSPFSGSALLAWNSVTDGGAEWGASLSFTYQNRNFNNLPHTYEHPPLGLLGASMTARLPHLPGRPTVSLIGNNLTNALKPGAVFETPNTGGILTLFNAPRSLLLSIEVAFGAP